MIFLILSILCSTIIAVVFRYFTDYKIDTFQAILYNYIVCLITGTLVMGQSPIQDAFWTTNWFPYALGLGSIFIGTFILIARTVQTFGISVTSVVQRMSMLIAVIFAFVVFNEPINTFKVVGIILAILAVFLTSIKKIEKSEQQNNAKISWHILLPISVFVLSGSIESVLQYVQKTLLQNNLGQLQFTTFLFGTAAFFGIFILIFNLLTKRMIFHKRHLISGIALGIPNFGSIYFLLKALDTDWDSSVIFPVNNVGIIVLSSIIAVLLFKEKLSKMNIAGILLAILAIILMTFST
jgi:drug/metabolite transporter (DMT)-like permease